MQSESKQNKTMQGPYHTVSKASITTGDGNLAWNILKNIEGGPFSILIYRSLGELEAISKMQFSTLCTYWRFSSSDDMDDYGMTTTSSYIEFVNNAPGNCLMPSGRY